MLAISITQTSSSPTGGDRLENVEIVNDDYLSVIEVARTAAIHGLVPSVADIKEQLPNLHVNKIRALLEKGERLGVIDIRYHEDHGKQYYMYIGPLPKREKRFWWF